MSFEDQLRRIQQEESKRIKEQMSLVSNITAQLIFSDNGLTNEQKIETQKVFNDLLTGNASPETIARAHELIKKYEGK